MLSQASKVASSLWIRREGIASRGVEKKKRKGKTQQLFTSHEQLLSVLRFHLIFYSQSSHVSHTTVMRAVLGSHCKFSSIVCHCKKTPHSATNPTRSQLTGNNASVLASIRIVFLARAAGDNAARAVPFSAELDPNYLHFTPSRQG